MAKGKVNSTKRDADAERLQLIRDIHDRIDAVIAQSGLTKTALSQRATGGNGTMLRDMERKNSLPALHTLNRLARELGVEPEWLAFGRRFSPSPSALALVGSVQAGAWREPATMGIEPTPLTIGPDWRYPAESQFALRVEGESLNRVARPGDVLVCVTRSAYGEPRPGDLAIVQLTDPSGRIEVTAKRWRPKGSLLYLAADSDHPLWSAFSHVVQLDAPEPAMAVEVKGVVLHVLRSL